MTSTKIAFRKVFLRQLIAIGIVGAIAVASIFVKKYSGSEPILLPQYPLLTAYAPLALIAIYLLWTMRNWRCPECKKSLGRGLFTVSRCPHCLVELR